VNQAIHDKTIRRSKNKLKTSAGFHSSSKFPPLFGIDLIIEDSEGVKLEGEQFGFKVLIIDGNDTLWNDRIKTQIAEII
jgi:hypothetical protein